MICPNCKGKGDVMGDIDWFVGVATLGITALLDASKREECNICKGKGLINEER